MPRLRREAATQRAYGSADESVSCRRFRRFESARRKDIHDGKTVRNTRKRHYERARGNRNRSRDYRFCDRFYFGFAYGLTGHSGVFAGAGFTRLAAFFSAL